MNKKEIDEKVRASFPMKHRWHNRFHLEMPFGLINDPNGLSFYKGEYHIFYQWNPLGCEHKHKSWAHVKTRDFVNYSLPELSLWPSDDHDKDGCYSGCGYVQDGALHVLYTCNKKDENNVRIPAQRIGTLLEDGTVRKDEVIIPHEPEGYTGHFRDPCRFQRNGRTYLVLGAQTQEERGCVLVYREEADGWKLMGELKTQMGKFGYMWECPTMLKFGDHDVLLFSPQGLEAKEYAYQNLYQSGYLAGHLSLAGMELLHGSFQELDKGFDFYAPQAFQHEGRNILLGWMGMPDRDSQYPTAEKGWMYTLTMPRVLTLRQGHLYSQPAEEMKALRVAESACELVGRNQQMLAADLHEGSEILLNVVFGQAKKLALTLSYGLEKLCFRYDRTQQVMQIDRTGMKLGGHGVRSFKLYAEESLTLQLFVDRTAIEAFFQHGEQTASLLVFPEKNIVPDLSLRSDQPMENVAGTVWKLDGFKFNK